MIAPSTDLDIWHDSIIAVGVVDGDFEREL